MTTTAFDLSTPEGRALAKIRCADLQRELHEWPYQFELKNGRLPSEIAEIQLEMGAALTELCDLDQRLVDVDNAAVAARSANADPVSAATTSAEGEKDNTTSADE
jgi:hypothetical protein